MPLFGRSTGLFSVFQQSTALMWLVALDDSRTPWTLLADVERLHNLDPHRVAQRLRATCSAESLFSLSLSTAHLFGIVGGGSLEIALMRHPWGLQKRFVLLRLYS